MILSRRPLLAVGLWIVCFLGSFVGCRSFSGQIRPGMNRRHAAQASRIHRTYNQHTISSTMVHQGNKTQQLNELKTTQSTDGSFLLGDLSSILVACQLLGLQDVLDSSTFWQNGGWFQPLSMPITLPVLVLRISMNSLSWIVADRITGRIMEQPDSETNGTLTMACQTAVIFALARLLLAAILSVMNFQVWDGIEVLRECYYVSLLAVSTRYLLIKFYS